MKPLFHWTDAKDVYTGPQSAPKTTVLRNSHSSFEYTTDYFSCCSWWVHQGNTIGGVIEIGTQDKNKNMAQITVYFLLLSVR